MIVIPIPPHALRSNTLYYGIRCACSRLHALCEDLFGGKTTEQHLDCSFPIEVGCECGAVMRACKGSRPRRAAGLESARYSHHQSRSVPRSTTRAISNSGHRFAKEHTHTVGHCGSCTAEQELPHGRVNCGAAIEEGSQGAHGAKRRGACGNANRDRQPPAREGQRHDGYGGPQCEQAEWTRPLPTTDYRRARAGRSRVLRAPVCRVRPSRCA